MELPIKLYEWLCSVGALTEYEVQSKDDTKAILDNESTQQFELGLKMPILMDYLYKVRVFTYMSNTSIESRRP